MISFRLGCSTHKIEDEQFQEVANWITTIGNRAIVVKEVSIKDGHHVHGLVEFSQTPSTFRQQFIAKYNVYKGKKGIYSVKPEKITITEFNELSDDDFNKALRYLCKGENDSTLPVVFKNNLLTQSQIIMYHDAYWEINRKISHEEGRSPETAALKKREKALTFVQEVAQKILSKGEKDWGIDHRTKTVVFNQVMTGLGVKGKTLDAIIVRRLCYGVLNIIAPSAMKEHMWSQVFPNEYEYDT